MGRFGRFAVALSLLALVAAPLWAGGTGKMLVRLKGWVVDSYCGAKNANAEGKDCVLDCQKKGAKLVFVTEDGTTYSIADQEKALERVGVELTVFGTHDGNRNLTISKYIVPGEEEKKADPGARSGFGPERTMKPAEKSDGGDGGGDQ